MIGEMIDWIMTKVDDEFSIRPKTSKLQTAFFLLKVDQA